MSLQISNLASTSQIAKIMIDFKDIGIVDRAHRLRVLAAIVGRSIKSTKDVTRDEAGLVIGTLHRKLVHMKYAHRRDATCASCKREHVEVDDQGLCANCPVDSEQSDA